MSAIRLPILGLAAMLGLPLAAGCSDLPPGIIPSRAEALRSAAADLGEPLAPELLAPLPPPVVANHRPVEPLYLTAMLDEPELPAADPAADSDAEPNDADEAERLVDEVTERVLDHALREIDERIERAVDRIRERGEDHAIEAEIDHEVERRLRLHELEREADELRQHVRELEREIERLQMRLEMSEHVRELTEAILRQALQTR